MPASPSSPTLWMLPLLHRFGFEVSVIKFLNCFVTNLLLLELECTRASTARLNLLTNQHTGTNTKAHLERIIVRGDADLLFLQTAKPGQKTSIEIMPGFYDGFIFSLIYCILNYQENFYLLKVLHGKTLPFPCQFFSWMQRPCVPTIKYTDIQAIISLLECQIC